MNRQNKTVHSQCLQSNRGDRIETNKTNKIGDAISIVSKIQSIMVSRGLEGVGGLVLGCTVWPVRRK